MSVLTLEKRIKHFMSAYGFLLISIEKQLLSPNVIAEFHKFYMTYNINVPLLILVIVYQLPTLRIGTICFFGMQVGTVVSLTVRTAA